MIAVFFYCYFLQAFFQPLLVLNPLRAVLHDAFDASLDTLRG